MKSLCNARKSSHLLVTVGESPHKSTKMQHSTPLSPKKKSLLHTNLEWSASLLHFSLPQIYGGQFGISPRKFLRLGTSSSML